MWKLAIRTHYRRWPFAEFQTILRLRYLVETPAETHLAEGVAWPIVYIETIDFVLPVVFCRTGLG